MLFDPTAVLREPLALVGTLLVVLVGNAGVAFLIVRGLGHSTGTALTVGAGMAQIGEFSFILASLGIGLRVLPEGARDLILGASIFSILANPAIFATKEWIRTRIERREVAAGLPASPGEHDHEIPVTRLKEHIVLVGCGRVGRLVRDGLLANGSPLLVIEEAAEVVEQLRARSIETIAGNAAQPTLLRAANIGQARMLFVAIPNAFEAGQIVQQARKANPGIEIVARAHFDTEVEHLSQLGADIVIMGEQEIARTMLEKAREFLETVASTGDAKAR
jgi:CPA2 family monovalent cation:H+ antiporter-2